MYEESIASLARENEKSHKMLRSKEEELEQALRNYKTLAGQFDEKVQSGEGGRPSIVALQQEAMELRKKLGQS